MNVVLLTLRLLAEAGALVGPLLVMLYRPRPATPEAAPAAPRRASRAPLIANMLALGLFFFFLWWPFDLIALPDAALLTLALAGVAVVIAGFVVILWARAALGASWSFAPKASEATGLATSGPYALVRHPIYLGMVVLFFGTAVAFANGVGALLVLLLVLPTLVWRARVEERLLAQVFGAQYAAYRLRTKMVVPYLL